MQSKEFKEAFYEADHLAFQKAKPAIERIFNEAGYKTTIQETEDGDRVDILMTATTKTIISNINIPYTIELKNRQGKYTFQKFWECEEAWLNKDEDDLTKEEKTLGSGMLIKLKKIKALLKHLEQGRRAYYCLYFPDDVIALWKIDENTKYGEIDLYYDKYNVHRGEKELQHNYTLKLHDADFIYNCNTNERIR